MRRSTIFVLALVVLALLAAASLPAQSLLDNEHYKKAQELKAQSDAAYAAGDYDLSASLAAQAKEELAKSDAWVQEELGRYRANGWGQIAVERLAEAKADGADKRSPELYGEAAGAVDSAMAAYGGGSWLDSIDFAKLAIATLGRIPAAQAAVAVKPVEKPVETPVEEPAAEPGTPELPATYTVRLIPERRDCLWRIAGYPFVYNNPWKWKVLYAANRDILLEPDNPDLIEVGQVLVIPSIAGETREGMYDPSLEYPTFGAQ